MTSKTGTNICSSTEQIEQNLIYGETVTAVSLANQMQWAELSYWRPVRAFIILINLLKGYSCGYFYFRMKEKKKKRGENKMPSVPPAFRRQMHGWFRPTARGDHHQMRNEQAAEKQRIYNHWKQKSTHIAECIRWQVQQQNLSCSQPLTYRTTFGCLPNRTPDATQLFIKVLHNLKWLCTVGIPPGPRLYPPVAGCKYNNIWHSRLAF